MDLSINLTLFVQIFHFIVAYFLLKKIILRPAVDLVLAKEEQELERAKKLQAQASAIEQQYRTIHDLWYAARLNFASYLSVKFSFHNKKTASITLDDLSDKEKDDLEQTIKNSIVDRIKNV